MSRLLHTNMRAKRPSDFRVFTDSEVIPVITITAASPEFARDWARRNLEGVRIRKIKRVKGGAS